MGLVYAMITADTNSMVGSGSGGSSTVPPLQLSALGRIINSCSKDTRPLQQQQADNFDGSDDINNDSNRVTTNNNRSNRSSSIVNDVKGRGTKQDRRGSQFTPGAAAAAAAVTCCCCCGDLSAPTTTTTSTSLTNSSTSYLYSYQY